MSNDEIQEVADLLTYAIEHKDWNSVDEALELLTGDLSDSVLDDEP